MIFSRHILLFAFVAVVLSGCGHVAPFNEWSQSDKKNIDEPGEQYSEYVSTYIDENVEIYDLSDDLPATPLVYSHEQNVAATSPIVPAPINRQPIAPLGVPSSVDNNVTVYPFDDHSYGATSRTLSPEILPPAQYKEDFPSPFSGADDSMMDPSNMDRVYFSHGSSAIDQDGTKIIDKISDKAGDNAVHLVNVVGHASKRAETNDPVQRAILNMRMSMKRAMAVSESLVEKGVSADLIKTSALGDTSAAVILDGRSQEAADRRVEIATISSTASSLNAVSASVSNRILGQGSVKAQSNAEPVTLFPLK